MVKISVQEHSPKARDGIPSLSSRETRRSTSRVAANGDIGESFRVLILEVSCQYCLLIKEQSLLEVECTSLTRMG